ncbi:MAG: nucleoside hydrolase [Rhodovulum sulfidophilum]|uniref:Nucleoside hydrolase n=1 Tax=Rhodovulum sulfidophilum TaxID=35806 RepID=A0A2W5Q4A4_RHOSU|nr:MAG: nucleoside hydrolase [Rhodovulum sulfidophilum]
MRKKIILDVDTGTDDAVAIMLAALHPKIELCSVTTVNGNVEVHHCTDNSLRVLDLVGRPDVPVYEGATRPIVRDDFPVARHLRRNPGVHMDVVPFPGTARGKETQVAAAHLVEAMARRPGEITLVAVGPLTNVAIALALDPAFARNCRELVIMGGAIAKSNITPSAEFNIWADPEASAQVMRADFARITLVPLEATHEALVSLGQCAALRALGTPAGIGSAELIEHRIRGYEAHQPTGTPEAAPVHDALCVAALVEPEVIRTIHANVVIETRGEFTIGRTVVDHERRTKREPNCHVAIGADRSRFLDLLTRTFAAGAGADDRRG